jgi:hypothetical protein
MRIPNQSTGADRIHREASQFVKALNPSAVGEFGRGLWCTDDSCASLAIACKNGHGTFVQSGSLGACVVGDTGSTLGSLAAVGGGGRPQILHRRFFSMGTGS